MGLSAADDLETILEQDKSSVLKIPVTTLEHDLQGVVLETDQAERAVQDGLACFDRAVMIADREQQARQEEALTAGKLSLIHI